MDISFFFSAAGAAAWGCCAYADLTLSPAAQEKAELLCAHPAGVFVAAFPYFSGLQPGNLSLYARGEDYHQVLLRRLGRVAAALKEAFPHHTFVPGTDASPLNERDCARLAGLGRLGRHGLVIVPPYGSWVFLGTILTDLELPSAAAPAPDCLNCGACLNACPTGALTASGVDATRCLSALTQKKGTLTPTETALLTDHPLIWGCDCCQLACPYNQNAVHASLSDLTGHTGAVPYLASLSPQDLEGLTNRTFRSAYGNRAFVWRGPAVLRRNLALKREKSSC